VQESHLRAPLNMRITLLIDTSPNLTAACLACSRLRQHPRATERIPNGCIQQLYVEDKYHPCEKKANKAEKKGKRPQNQYGTKTRCMRGTARHIMRITRLACSRLPQHPRAFA
jgi:hypothetical protein